jgi:hypothetical protein
MKRFTPDLHLRFAWADERVSDEAERQWELARKTNRRYLKAAWSILPAGVRFLLKKFYLHDARVLAVRKEKRALSVTLQLEPPDSTWLHLVYLLAASPRVLKHQELTEGDQPLCWLYDEVEVFPKEVPVFRHSILFTRGIELQVPFYDLWVSVLGKGLSPETEENLEALFTEQGG